MSKRIVLIRFSSRKNGNSAAICEHIREYYSSEAVSSYIIDNQIVGACNACDYECLQSEKKCPCYSEIHNRIMDEISNADLAYYIVPNYCGYPCANYFAFNERSVGYFNMNSERMQKYMEVPKRFIVISNTESESFVNVMKQQVNTDPEILYLKTSKYHKRSISGDMMDAPEANTDLERFLKGYSF